MKKMLLALLLFCGCAANKKTTYSADELVIDSYKILEGSYDEAKGSSSEIIQDKDRLKIVAYSNKRQDLEEAIDKIGKEIGYKVEEGMIALPELSNIRVEGLNLQTAKEKIEKAYENRVEIFLSFEKKRSSNVILLGEVNRPGKISVSEPVSLKDALGCAGGIAFTGDDSYIQVIRGNLKRPKIYVVSWSHIAQLSNDSLLLIPGDVVYVASKPISEWNRFISQLIPTFSRVEILEKPCECE